MYLQTNLSRNELYSKLYMFISSIFKLKIDNFRNLHNWSDCTKVYFESLDFLSIEDNVELYKRYKKLDESIIDESNYFSIAYVKDNKLIRIDSVGKGILESETYIIYNKENKVINAYTFYTGCMFGKQRQTKPELFLFWNYSYKNKNIKSLCQQSYADYVFYHHNKDKRIKYYIHDEKGVESIYQTLIRNELFKNIVVYKRIIVKKRGRTEKEIIQMNKAAGLV